MSRVDKFMDKFEGGLIGSAVGDAFGYPLMALSYAQIVQRFEKNGALELAVSRKTGTALFTEATQMSLFTADGIIWAYCEKVGRENGAVANYVFYSYQLWLYMQTRSIAGSEYEWLFDKKQNPNVSSLLRSKGLGKNRRLTESNIDALFDARNGVFGTLSRKVNDNTDAGAVKRVVPVGLYYGQNSDMAFRIGCDVGAITHSAPDGYLPCGVYTAIVAELLQGNNIDDAVNEAMALLAAYPDNERTYSALQKAVDLANDDDVDPREGLDELGDGLSAISCLAIAVYSAILHQTNYKFAIALAANHDGDSSACAAITGGILGTWYGLKRLPKDWTKKVQYRSLLETVADVLYDNSEFQDPDDDDDYEFEDKKANKDEKKDENEKEDEDDKEDDK